MTIHDGHDALEGHTRFAPLCSKSATLVDMDGEVVDTGECEHPPGQSVQLTDDGRNRAGRFRATRSPADHSVVARLP